MNKKSVQIRYSNSNLITLSVNVHTQIKKYAFEGFNLSKMLPGLEFMHFQFYEN